MSDPDVQRVIGGIEARTGILESRFAVMEQRIDSRLDRIDSRVSDIHEAITTAKGGWRMLGVLGAAAGVISGVAVTIYHFFFTR